MTQTAMLKNNELAVVRGKRILVEVEKQEKIGDLLMPDSHREGFKRGRIIAWGPEVDDSGMVADASKAVNKEIGNISCYALYLEGKGIYVGDSEIDENLKYELVNDEDVVMVINK